MYHLPPQLHRATQRLRSSGIRSVSRPCSGCSNSQTPISIICITLQVKTIILCGHYNCGAVKAALQLPHTTPGLVNCWISDIRECRNQAEKELRNLDAEQQLAR